MGRMPTAAREHPFLHSTAVRVRQAIIPAAGLGTRFLPMTKVVPKELLPMVDVPALQLVIEEAVGAGIETVIVVNHPSKSAVERFFEPTPELLRTLEKAGKHELVARLEHLDALDVRFVHQPEALGLGHAVGMARELVQGEPFAVLLPDEIMGSSALLAAMLDASARTGGSVVGLKRVPRDEVNRYGVIAPAGDVGPDGVVAVTDLVEKPPVESAPSDLIIIGRYVCSAAVMDEIGRLTPGAGGELQLTDALRAACGYEPFHGLVGDLLPGGLDRFDTGNPVGWWEANLELGLRHPVLGEQLREIFARIAARPA